MSDHPARSGSVRYGQCWEDADVLSAALDVRPGDRVLSIVSAGDNALALLADDPAEVVAVDLSAAQLACLALRVAAFRVLEHGEVLELVGSRPSRRRAALYARCRPALDAEARAFWDARPDAVAAGVGGAGTFERYLSRFRRLVLPLAHPRRRVRRLLRGGGDVAERRAWYDRHWESRRWRALFAVVASQRVLGGARFPTAFSQVEGGSGGVADRLRRRVRDAVTATDPAENPYLAWILTGAHGEALPRYLRAEHFGAIRERLDRITPRHGPLADALEPDAFDAFNLSDVFEYLPPADSDALFAAVARAGRPGARAAYWNLLVDRAPPGGAGLRPLADLSERLHARDKAPFYGAFRVDEVA